MIEFLFVCVCIPARLVISACTTCIDKEYASIESLLLRSREQCHVLSGVNVTDSRLALNAAISSAGEPGVAGDVVWPVPGRFMRR